MKVACPNSDAGGEAPLPAAWRSQARAVRGLGFTKRETESTGVDGGRRGSQPCRYGGRKTRVARWPPWPVAKACGALGQGI